MKLQWKELLSVIFGMYIYFVKCICALDKILWPTGPKRESHSGRLLCEKEVINSLAKDWWSEQTAFLQHPRLGRLEVTKTFDPNQPCKSTKF